MTRYNIGQWNNYVMLGVGKLTCAHSVQFVAEVKNEKVHYYYYEKLCPFHKAPNGTSGGPQNKQIILTHATYINRKCDFL